MSAENRPVAPSIKHIWTQADTAIKKLDTAIAESKTRIAQHLAAKSATTIAFAHRVAAAADAANPDEVKDSEVKHDEYLKEHRETLATLKRELDKLEKDSEAMKAQVKDILKDDD